MATGTAGDGYSSTLAGFLDAICRTPWTPLAILVALTLATYLPGVINLPPVDRTEIVFAETTRGMITRGAWTDPRYGETVHAFRPIGTFWAQGAAATIAGPEQARNITVYRIPSLIAVVLSVLTFYCLAAPRLGRRTALLASALFAVAPLTALVSQLAIAEGLSLLPAVVVMMCLMRIYDADGEPPASLAWLFWIALGAGTLVNALLIPILVLATLVALAIMDRGDVRWIGRLKPLSGLPLALLIASPWLYVRALQDGVPFAGMGFRDVLEALGGSQDMKLRAWPGTFLLAAVVGFLPGTALIAPAMHRMWKERAYRLPRFLLAWVIGYLAYLELISSKPGTYTVQAIFPALAMAVALLVLDCKPGAELPRWHAMPWPAVAALFVLALFGGVYALAGSTPTLLAVVPIATVAGLFACSAMLGRRGDLTGWAIGGIAALGLFAATLLGVVFPSLDRLWPARQIERALTASCKPAAAGLLGFREPSGGFLLRADRRLQTPEAIARANPPIHIVEARWRERHAKALAGAGIQSPPAALCVSAYNAMRGCALDFAVLAAPDVCRPDPTAARCAVPPAPSTTAKGCD